MEVSVEALSFPAALLSNDLKVETANHPWKARFGMAGDLKPFVARGEADRPHRPAGNGRSSRSGAARGARSAGGITCLVNSEIGATFVIVKLNAGYLIMQRDAARGAFSGESACAAVARHRPQGGLPGRQDGGDTLASALCSPLSPRETEVLTWLARGLRADQIAHELGIARVTADLHVANAKRKLGAATREQALARALVLGLIEPFGSQPAPPPGPAVALAGGPL